MIRYSRIIKSLIASFLAASMLTCAACSPVQSRASGEAFAAVLEIIALDAETYNPDARHPSYDTTFSLAQQTFTLEKYAASPEYRAAEEWQAFLHTYDEDGEQLRAIGNAMAPVDFWYSCNYFCYTQEMVDELDDIAESYGLSLLGRRSTSSDTESGFDLAVTDAFLGRTNKVLGGYIYEDGTFQYDGCTYAEGGVMLNCQVRNSKKGVLDPVWLDMSGLERYEIASYTTTDGFEVVIAVGPERAIMIADLPDSYLSMRVYASVTVADMQRIAESFDFSALSK